MATDCLHYVFTTSTVPATGTSGSKGNFGSARSAARHSPHSKRIEFALMGMAASFARPSRAVTPPKPRSGLRRRRKGVDGEDLGRGTIGLAMIGGDHASAASVLVHRRPRRLATSSPQRLSAEKRVTRESKTFAAS